MNERNLSYRLARVADYVPVHSRLADIGSDHAYLPTFLLLNKKIHYAVAGEVVKGPYESALAQVKKNKFEKKITVRLADGLDAVKAEDKINVLTICGMGGALIADILKKGQEKGQLDGIERIILQPNVGEEIVRRWLQENKYKIIAETILEEDQKIYEIIVAIPNATFFNYSDCDLLFGPFLRKEKSNVFRKKWEFEIEKEKKVIQALRKSKTDQQEKILHLENKIKMIQEEGLCI